MKKTLKNIALVLVLLIGVFSIAGCGKKDSKKDDVPAIVGTWDHNGYVYKFNKDKTGSYDAKGIKMKFTYEDDGEKVSILYEGNTVASEYAYKVKGKTLIIKDSFDNDVEYTKK